MTYMRSLYAATALTVFAGAIAQDTQPDMTTIVTEDQADRKNFSEAQQRHTAGDSKRLDRVKALMAEIEREEQADEKEFADLLAEMQRRDAQRLNQIIELLAADKLTSTQDLESAALILQHGSIPEHYLLAHEIGTIAVLKGGTTPLGAYAEDRFLLSIDRKQRFGSQYHEINGQTQLLPLEDTPRTKVTPAFRQRHRIWTPLDTSQHMADPQQDLGEPQGSFTTAEQALALYHDDQLTHPQDLHHAALLLLHSDDPLELLLAHEFSAAALMGGVQQAGPVFARTLDKYLLSIGRPQRYATQEGPAADTPIMPLVRRVLDLDGTQATLERDWTTLQSHLREYPPEAALQDQQILARWVEKNSARLRELAMHFYTAYPREPRRWDAIAALLQRAPAQATEQNEATAQTQQAWLEELHTLHVALERSSDASPKAREQAAAFSVQQALLGAYLSPQDTSIAQIRHDLEQFAERFPQSGNIELLADMHLNLLETHRPDDLESILTELLDSPSRTLRETANGRIERHIRARSEPMQMHFTALDGREVDTAALRGKVVLVEFWATWCKPCIAEIPAIKRLYERYRADGFEVIGIALDEQKDRDRLLELIEEHRIRWPQYFDGKGWDNPYVKRYAIHAVPALFLLDQQSRLVSIHTSSEQLAAEVRGLLDLE